MQNNGLWGSILVFWAIILPTFGVQVGSLKAPHLRTPPNPDVIELEGKGRTGDDLRSLAKGFLMEFLSSLNPKPILVFGFVGFVGALC